MADRPCRALVLVPVSRDVARDCVRRWHRHNGPPPGDLFRVGVALNGELVAVGIAGRPTSRALDDGSTVELTRVASSGAKHATSKLYGALTRAAWALGYTLAVTYTEASEPGTSLRAAGFRVVAQRPARPGWSSIARPRDDRLYRSVDRTLWEATP